MQVFKVYFKIIQKNLPQMLIYLIVFVALATMFASLSPSMAAENFSETKSSIAVVNEDTGAPFAENLCDYLSEHCVVKDVGSRRDQLMDSLFFREVVYILRIPKGFSQDFLSGSGNMMLEKSIAPDSNASVQVDYLITRYLSIASLYNKVLPELTPSELARHIKSDLALESSVNLSRGDGGNKQDNLFNYYKYFAYSIMAIMILGITSNMMVFGQRDLKRRNYASCINNLSINLQLVLGNLVFAAVVWALMCAFTFVLYPNEMNNRALVPLMVNSFAYTIVCVAISLLFGNLVKSKNAQSALANVLSLGLSFISGVFVPQELLGETVQRIASFTPTYWYVCAVREMANGFTEKAVYALLIQLGFAVAFLSISLAISRYKSTSDQ